jgi:hypothetical protein
MNHGATEDAEKKRRKTHWAVKCFAVAAIVWILADVYAVYSAAYQALEAEKTLHAMDLAYSLLAEHHKSHSAWPNSWDDLRQVGIGETLFEHEWPKCENEMKSRVAIDFDKLPHNAAEAVTPIGPCYDYTHRPGYLRLKTLSEQPNDPETEPNDLSAEADPQ